MDSDTKFMLLVLGLPLAGLLYCGLGIFLMLSNPGIRDHPLISGTIFMLIPLTIGASIWINASAKAYRK